MTRLARLPIVLGVPLALMAAMYLMVQYLPGEVLYLYVALCLGSAWMVLSWGRVAWAFLGDTPLRKSARYHTAEGLVLHAMVMAVITLFRGFDILMGSQVVGSDAGVLAAALTGLLYSKAKFVYAGSINTKWLWPWWTFLAALVALAFVLRGW